MFVLACLGHWYTSLLYVGPVLVIGGAVGVQYLRDRRRPVRSGPPGPGEDR